MAGRALNVCFPPGSGHSISAQQANPPRAGRSPYSFRILPRIDAGPLALTAWFGLWHGLKASHDPTASLGWIYNLVNLQNGCDRDPLAVGIEFCKLGVVIFLPLHTVADSF